MDFQTFHKYIHLAKQGLCKPLLCRHCGEELQLVLGPEDGPALRCFYCNVLTLPGLALYSNIRAIVKEHFA